MARHLPTFCDVTRAAECLRQVELQREAAHQHDCALAQRRKYPVSGLDAEGRADGHRFLPEGRAVKAELALTL